MEIPWFGSLQLYIFFCSTFCPFFSGLKNTYTNFPTFWHGELMNVRLFTESSASLLTPGKIWWDEESQLAVALTCSGVLLFQETPSYEAWRVVFTPEVEI